MGNPDQAASQTSAPPAGQTFQEKVNFVVGQMVQDENGNYQLPDIEMSEELKVAANSERRRRTTEGALTKTRLELEAERKTTDKITKQVVGMKTSLSLTPEEQATLDELKYNDPDAWRIRVNELEKTQSTTLQSDFNSVRNEAIIEAEKENREKLLTEYNKSNPNAQITDEVYDHDLPPRITKALEAGTISFEEFLEKANKFLIKPKTTKQSSLKEKPNLNETGGGPNPAMQGREQSKEVPYERQLL